MIILEKMDGDKNSKDENVNKQPLWDNTLDQQVAEEVEIDLEQSLTVEEQVTMVRELQTRVVRDSNRRDVILFHERLAPTSDWIAKHFTLLATVITIRHKSKTYQKA